MNGYLREKDDEHIPMKFFQRVFEKTEKRALYPKEWIMVKGMAMQILRVNKCFKCQNRFLI